MNTTSIIQHLLKSAPGSLENHTPSSVPRPRPLRSGTGQNNSLGDRTKGILGGMVLAALLAFIGTTAVGQTHPFQTSASGIAQFLYDTNVPTSTLLVTQQSDIKGFSRDATVSIMLDGAEPIGTLTGFFNAYRFVGKGGKGGKHETEHLFGRVTGTSTNTELGIYYQGTITITSGTGRLDGATGTINFEAFQYGFIDPVFVTTPNTVPMDITYLGAYTLP